MYSINTFWESIIFCLLLIFLLNFQASCVFVFVFNAISNIIIKSVKGVGLEKRWGYRNDVFLFSMVLSFLKIIFFNICAFSSITVDSGLWYFLLGSFPTTHLSNACSSNQLFEVVKQLKHLKDKNQRVYKMLFVHQVEMLSFHL